jgi:transposase
MSSPRVYIGVDIAKESLQMDPFDGMQAEIDNTTKGIRSLIRRLQTIPHCMICCEATGGYETLLVANLLDAEIPVALVNPRQVRDFARSKGILAKTDKIDAAVVTLFAQQNQPSPMSKPPEWMGTLRSLLIRREELVHMTRQEKCRLDPAPPAPILRTIKAHLRFLLQQISKLEAQIKETTKEHEPLTQQINRFCQVNGLGTQSALYLIAFVPELGHLSDKQASALIGVAPYNDDSGKTKGIRRIRGGRARVRKVLYMAAVSAQQHNPILHEFYNRLIQQGKPPKVALTAVMRKLVVLANRIVSDPSFQPA